jgi:hypothetical protein
MTQIIWYEVWVDEGLFPPYILLLLALNVENKFEVYDPMEKRVVISESTYENAKNWLLEDEYILVNGRMIPD